MSQPYGHGALGAAFTATRGMQAVSLICMIGMTANFISEIVGSDQKPPSVLIGTLSVVCAYLHSLPKPS